MGKNKVEKVFRIEQRRIETREVYIKVNVDEDFTERDFDMFQENCSKGDDLVGLTGEEFGGWRDEFDVSEVNVNEEFIEREKRWKQIIYECSTKEDTTGKITNLTPQFSFGN